MGILGLVFVLVLNFGISWWNCYAVGSAWAEAKAAGGWPRWMCWMGAIMAASGFSWCFLFLLCFGASAAGLIGASAMVIALKLGYLLIVPGVILAGFMIMVDSWATAFREGGVLNYSVAVYNTYAQVHNTMSVLSSFGDAFSDVAGFFSGGSSSSSSDDDGAPVVLVIIIVGLALFGGIALTATLIRKYSATSPLRSIEELERLRDAGK